MTASSTRAAASPSATASTLRRSAHLHPRTRYRRPVFRRSRRAVTIEDYAYIGTRVTIMPNVRIGHGAVVASGAVVTKDVPPFMLVEACRRASSASARTTCDTSSVTQRNSNEHTSRSGRRSPSGFSQRGCPQSGRGRYCRDASDLSQIKDGTWIPFSATRFSSICSSRINSPRYGNGNASFRPRAHDCHRHSGFRRHRGTLFERREGDFRRPVRLHNVYRYTTANPNTPRSRSGRLSRDERLRSRRLDPAVAQGLFDASYLRDLLTECDLGGVIFNYAYPGEEPAICLGFIAAGPPRRHERAGILRDLERIPDTGRSWISRRYPSVTRASRGIRCSPM